MNQAWLEAAFAPPRAHGEPLARGALRVEPEDFSVEEQLGFAPAGTGQHVLLKVRKRNANTHWVARELAQSCGCRPADVGYAGLKDRRAVAVQWFSVPQSRLTPEAWRAVGSADFEVLEAYAHSRKLPRGALAANRFTIRIRDAAVDDARLAQRVAEIRRRGVPNYFGPQRFGRDGANLVRAAHELHSLRAPQRGLVLSAARSLVFNAVLAERVRDGSWEHLEDGDIANLDGRGSIFPVGTLEPQLLERCARLEIHPTGPLWGRGAPPSGRRVLELEARVAAEFPQACALAVGAAMRQERRSLRLAVHDLSWARDSRAIEVRFRLARGSFATAVLRELVESDAAQQGESEAD
ncbi:MAG: tRNA pseudouridine(13) synthase TruD [Gammaproteobacteria bacterium]|nr:MAG: tRNA pseudouridine(13) synthase TruD [Gammaproteobacteria bacterium]